MAVRATTRIVLRAVVSASWLFARSAAAWGFQPNSGASGVAEPPFGGAHFPFPSEIWPLLVALLIVVIAAGVWWFRKRQINQQRTSMRAFHALSEAIIAAESPEEIAERLADVLPQITHATHVRLYLYHRRSKALELVLNSDEPEPMIIPVDSPQDGLARGVAKCFTTKAPLHVADVRRNPVVSGEWKPGQPLSVAFLPLMAQQEVIGVLEAGNMTRPGYLTPEEQAAMQHLANQASAAMKLQEQHKVREQLLRSEKLAATGQLMSGIADQLRQPLESIANLSSTLIRETLTTPHDAELKQIAAEARHAADIVTRLVSFARPEDSTAKPFDLNALIGGLVQFRAPGWKDLNLRVQNRLAPEPAIVLGAQGQIERVFLDLLVGAEQSASASSAKTLTISSSSMGGRAVVELGFSAQDPAQDTHNANAEVCRGLIQSHGGEMRFRTQAGAAGFEIELPLALSAEPQSNSTAARRSSRPLTLMIVDADPTTQRQLLGMLATRGHRVVPVTAETSADAAQRLRFDAVVWAVRPGGWKWSEFHERLRSAVPSFVLVSDGYDADFAKSLSESGGYLLARPVQETELDRVLESLDTQTATRV
jgi:signal transduction histidine kinase